MSLYSKLREIGHGRLESLRRVTGYRIERLLSYPSYKPKELQIEEHLSNLENLVKLRYRSQGTELSEERKRNEIDNLVGYLDSQLEWEDKKRFSAAQIGRYEKLLERLAEVYSEK